MATLTSAQAASDYPIHTPKFGVVGMSYGEYEFSSNPSDGDVLELLWIPSGATVLGGWLYGKDIDTGTEELDLDLGTSDDTDQFGNFGVVTGDTVTGFKTEAGILLPYQGRLMDSGLQSFTSDTKLQLLINTNAATFTSGKVWSVCYFTQTATVGD